MERHMTADQRAPDIQVSLARLAAYLGRAGWTFVNADDLTAMWQRFTTVGDDRQDIRVVLPLREDVSDYADYVDRALRAISFTERRPIPDVATEIRFGPTDFMAVRLTPSTPSGEAPLTVARDVLDGLRNFVVGSAAALSVPQRPVPPSYRPFADSFASDVRVSTSAGSFIVTLAVPLTPTQATIQRSPDGQGDVANRSKDLGVEPAEQGVPAAEATGETLFSPPVGRLVTARMRRVTERSIQVARQVIAGNAQLSFFEEGPAATGNALELEALSAIGRREDRPYTIRFSYSPSVDDEHLRPDSFVVTPEVREVFDDAAARLRTPKPMVNATIIGRITGLSRARTSKVGDVTVDGQSADGPAHKYRVRLQPEDYDLAVRAHRRGLDVALVGDVVLRGHQYVVEPLRSIDVIGGFEDES
jgi:hypothetical protein